MGLDTRAQREELVTRWLGERPRSGEVVGGFLEIDASGSNSQDEIRQWLAPATAPFVRSIKVTGSYRAIHTTILLIARCELPLLCHLALRQRTGDDHDPIERSPEVQASRTRSVDDAELDAFVKMTPRLSTVELTGRIPVSRFSHPNTTGMAMTGYRRVDLGDLPKLASLDLAIHDPINLSDTTPPVSLIADGLVDAWRMPSLVRLDLSRNDDGGAVNVVKLASHLPVMSQLRSLRLPRFRSQDDVGLLQMILSRMPDLETLELVRVPEDQRSLVARLVHPRARITCAS